MSAIDLIYGAITALALIAGFIIEWRRSDAAAHIVVLEARVQALEGRPDNEARLAAVEQALERLRRNL